MMKWSCSDGGLNSGGESRSSCSETDYAALNEPTALELMHLAAQVHQRKSQNTTECVPVPSSEHVAEIVGRQGCKIKALRAKTNTYIKTPVRGEDSIFVVTGRKDDVLAAKQEILSAAEHFTQIRASRRHSQGGIPAPGHITAYVRVPYKFVGLVVGPKGATIKRIQQQTHTYIVTPSRDKEPVFEVTGLSDNVEAARREIETHIGSRTGHILPPSAYTDNNNTANNGDFDFARQVQCSNSPSSILACSQNQRVSTPSSATTAAMIMLMNDFHLNGFDAPPPTGAAPSGGQGQGQGCFLPPPSHHHHHQSHHLSANSGDSSVVSSLSSCSGLPSSFGSSNIGGGIGLGSCGNAFVGGPTAGGSLICKPQPPLIASSNNNNNNNNNNGVLAVNNNLYNNNGSDSLAIISQQSLLDQTAVLSSFQCSNDSFNNNNNLINSQVKIGYNNDWSSNTSHCTVISNDSNSNYSQQLTNNNNNHGAKNFHSALLQQQQTNNSNNNNTKSMSNCGNSVDHDENNAWSTTFSATNGCNNHHCYSTASPQQQQQGQQIIIGDNRRKDYDHHHQQQHNFVYTNENNHYYNNGSLLYTNNQQQQQQQQGPTLAAPPAAPPCSLLPSFLTSIWSSTVGDDFLPAKQQQQQQQNATHPLQRKEQPCAIGSGSKSGQDASSAVIVGFSG